MDEAVSADENITRFINQKAYFRPNDGTVRHNAFMPNRDGEVSVYRITGIDDSEVYAIGTKYFAEITGKPLMGRADIIVSEVFKHDLRIQSHQDPHPRHQAKARRGRFRLEHAVPRLRRRPPHAPHRDGW